MPDNLKKLCKDHEGNEFFSIKDMTDSWGISPIRFFQRRQRGWSLKRALTTKTRTYKKRKLTNENRI